MFLFFIFMNRCGLGGCSGHSSRKKSRCSRCFQSPVHITRHLSYAFFSKHLYQGASIWPAGARRRTREWMPLGGALGSGGWSRGVNILAKGMDIALFQALLFACALDLVACFQPGWLFSVKILVPLNTNWVCYARQKYGSVFSNLTGDTSEPQGQYSGYSLLISPPVSRQSQLHQWMGAVARKGTHPSLECPSDGPGAESSVLEKKSWVRILRRCCLRFTWRL